MQRRKTTCRISLLLILILSLMSVKTLAFWNKIKNPATKTISEEINVGKWYMPKSGEPGVIVFDANNPPTVMIPKDTIVYYIGVDGQIKIFTSLTPNGVDPNKPNYDPTDPPTSWTDAMEYGEDTREYRSFQQYHRGDLVVFNGKVYEYDYWIPHNPNTVTEKNPEVSPGRWIERTDLLNEHTVEDLWFRYKIYYEDDIVYYKKKYYKSLKSGFAGRYPDGNQAGFWQEIPKP